MVACPNFVACETLAPVHGKVNEEMETALIRLPPGLRRVAVEVGKYTPYMVGAIGHLQSGAISGICRAARWMHFAQISYFPIDSACH